MPEHGGEDSGEFHNAFAEKPFKVDLFLWIDIGTDRYDHGCLLGRKSRTGHGGGGCFASIEVSVTPSTPDTIAIANAIGRETSIAGRPQLVTLRGI